jgi:hypothetical protein
MSSQLRSFLLLWCFVTGASSSANAADAVLDVMTATFKITNKSSTATCFVIARPSAADARKKELVVVTAAHVFEQMSGNDCRIVLREKRADGSFARVEVTLKIRSGKKRLWSKHPQVDVAAIKITLPSDRRIAPLDLDRLADESAVKSGKLLSAKEVWIPCYPAQLEASSAGFPVLRRGSVASFPLTPTARFKTFLVDYTTFGGDSGAPVTIRDRTTPGSTTERPLIVGLVIGQHRETTKSITPIEERTTHRPMGLAIVVHAEFIRQTIDRLPK